MAPPPLSTGDLMPEPEREPDPHKRARLRYGDYPGAIMSAAASSGQCQSAWVRYVESRREVVIELTFFQKQPLITPEQKSEAARAAAREVRDWLGPTYEGWTVRVRERRCPI